MDSSDWRSDGPLWSELTSAFGGIAQLLEPAGLRLTPERLIEAAEEGVPHADAAGLTLWPRGGEPRTIGPDGSIAHTVDQIQYATGQGPCLDAATGNDLVRVRDLADDPRWPAFRTHVLDTCSIRS